MLENPKVMKLYKKAIRKKQKKEKRMLEGVIKSQDEERNSHV